MKFWLLVVLVIGGLFLVMVKTRPPQTVPQSPEAAVAPGSPSGSEIPPTEDSRPTPTSEPGPSGAEEPAAQPMPIQSKMAGWSASYRSHMQLLLDPLTTIERSPDVDRSVCNSLLTATYNAQSDMPESPDPDIEKSFRGALDNFAEGGKFCLQRKAGLRDTYLLLAKGGITLVEDLLDERYSESGVPGLAEPKEGGSEIGHRAVEFTRGATGRGNNP
jgi:hypothetical protein